MTELQRRRRMNPRRERIISETQQRQADLARQMVALAFGVPAPELSAATRRRARVAFARQVAMYLTHIAYSMPLAHVGAAFGRDRTTASHACRLVEERRDDPRLDTLLTALEQGLRLVPSLSWSAGSVRDAG